MSFVKIGKFELLSGTEAGKAFRNLVSAIGKVLVAEDVSLETALETISNNLPDDFQDGEKFLLGKLRDWVAETGSQELADLLETLGTLENSSDANRRKLGWPAASWSLPSSLSGRLDPFTLELDAKSGAYFEVLQEDDKTRKNLPLASTYESVCTLSLNGSLSSELKTKFDVPVGGISVSADGKIDRSIDYYFGFSNQSSIVGLALSSALSQIASPTKPDDLLSAFRSGKMGRLCAIGIEGDGDLGGSLGINAKFPSSYGTFGVKLSGKARLSKAFKYKITSPTDGILALSASTDRSKARSGEIGVSYVVGLSTLAPEQATKLLQKVTSLHEHIVKIDEKATEIATTAKSWLKPGDLIKSKLEKRLSDLFIKTKDTPLPRTPIAALAMAFGVSKDQSLTTKAVKDSITDQAAELIGNVLDELPDIFELSDENIRKRLNSVFQDAVDPETLSLLDTDVFAKLDREINDALSDMAKKLDDDVAQAIEKAFGMSGGELVDAVRNVIKKAREVSQKILDGISKAQTDLLAAEIGWSRAKTQNREVDFTAEFDISKTKAKTAFSSAISSPSSFGDLLLRNETIPGIAITQLDLVRTLTVSESFGWGVSFFGFSASWKKDRSRQPKVIRTLDGIYVNTTGTVGKTSKLLDETRTVNFVSALNLYESRLTKADTNEAKPPNAPIQIKLDFKEDDGGMRIREAEALLDRFKAQGILSPDVYSSIIKDVESAVETANRRFVEASLSIGLAVSSASVRAMLEYVKEDQGRAAGLDSGDSNVLSAIVSALAETDKESIQSIAGADDEALETLSDLELDLDTSAGRREFLGSIATDTLGTSVAGLRPERRRRMTKILKRKKQKEEAEKYANGMAALSDVLARAAQIQFDKLPLDPSNEKEVERITNEWQEEMNALIAYFMDAGTPPPGFVSSLWPGKVPQKTVGLFVALQELTFRATGTRPPLTVSFKPESGTPTSYFSFAK